jgi:hypothetical protein
MPMTHVLLAGYHRVIELMIRGAGDPGTLVRVLVELLLPLRLQFALSIMYANATS